MEPKPTVLDLKKVLQSEVNMLFRHDRRLWNRPIVEVLQKLKNSGVQAVVFGGTLRSLLVSRLYHGRVGRPRDLDLVVTGIPFEDVEHHFRSLITRRTRFGGVQLKQDHWQFDMWSVGDTWALRKEGRGDAGFAALPSTTPFNLEAVAVEAWPQTGRVRQVFSGDEQFFEGVLTRTLELNRFDNPYPVLTTVRALVLASELRFRVGPTLSKYIASTGSEFTVDELEHVQMEHYGHLRMSGRTLQSFVAWVADRSERHKAIQLPNVGQLLLWHPETEEPRLRIHWSEGNSTSAERAVHEVLPSTVH